MDWFDTALSLAKDAAALGEVPVGAVVISEDRLIASAHNRIEADQDPCAHAEILAIKQAVRHLGTRFLTDCTLLVTLEPCPMCAQAIRFARIRRLVFGAYDSKGGGVEHGPRIYHQSSCHHRPEIVGGVMEQYCRQLLTDFFQQKRA